MASRTHDYDTYTPSNKQLTGSLSFCCVPFRRSPSLRLRVSSRFDYGFTFTLPFRLPFVTSWLRLRLRLHTSNNHLAGSLTFRFVPFRHVLLRICDFAFHPRANLLRFYVHFAVSRSFRDVVTEITTARFITSRLRFAFCVPSRQDAMIMTRLHTSNNHLAGSLTFCCVSFRHVLLRVCDFAFHPRTKIVYFTSFY